MKIKHPLNLLAAKTVLGLEINGRYMGAVQIFQGSRGTEVRHAALGEMQDPNQIEIELKNFLRAQGLGSDILITAMPTALAYIRTLDLPISNARKLYQIIKYQMEPLVPRAVEEVVTDFLDPERGRALTAIGVEKSDLSHHLKTLAGAGLEPHRVTIQEIALFSLYLRICGGKTKGTVAIVRLGGEETAVQVIRNGRLDFIRVFHRAKKPEALLNETFRIYGLMRPPGALNEILVTGDPAAVPGIVDKIGRLTSARTSFWRPFDAVPFKGEKLADDLQAKLSVPLGLALSGENGAQQNFNLRREGFAPKSNENIKGPTIFFFFALLLFLGLWTMHTFRVLHIENVRYDTLRKEISTVFTEAFPQAKKMVRGQEPAQMRQGIGEEREKYQWINQAMIEGPVLDNLLKLTRSVAGFADLRVEHIFIERGVVHVDGRTSSFKAIDKLKEKFSSHFSNVKLVGAKMDKREKIVLFSFVLKENQ